MPSEYLHPEFGWFCPSTSARRKARLLASVVLFAIVGIIILRAGREPQMDAPVAARVEEAPPRTDVAQTTVPTATTDGLRSPEIFRTACEGDPWSYIDGTCKAEKPHRHKSVRAANNNASVSRFSLGRSSRPVVASSEAHTGAAGADASAEAVTLDMSIPPAPRAPAHTNAHTKVHKASPSRNAGRDLPSKPSWRDDSWNAQASVSPRSQNSGNRDQWSWGWSPPQPSQPARRK